MSVGRLSPHLVEHRLAALATHGKVGETGVSRRVYDPAWVAARDMCVDWAKAAGLSVHVDAVGSLWARADGREGGDAIVTGSHLDSQTPGGGFDGALGIVAGFLALEQLLARFGPPRRPVEIVAFCEEEGSRFPTAGFWGSRAVTGHVAPGDVVATQDYDGVSISEAMRHVGLDPDRVTEATRRDIAAFLEVHIEQGPVLEQADLPVAIVTAVTGINHREITLTGTANHAGAFPMDLRRDPMAGFAEITSRVIDHAHRLGRPAVTTVGRVTVAPNFPAIQPGSVTFTIDARHPDQTAHQAMLSTHLRVIEEVAMRRDLGWNVSDQFHHDPAPADSSILAHLQAAAEAEGLRAMNMVSGAGHDTQRMASICPTAMIFVRSKDGRSHTPDEYSSPEDCAAGVQLLAGTLHRLAWSLETSPQARCSELSSILRRVDAGLRVRVCSGPGDPAFCRCL